MICCSSTTLSDCSRRIGPSFNQSNQGTADLFACNLALDSNRPRRSWFQPSNARIRAPTLHLRTIRFQHQLELPYLRSCIQMRAACQGARKFTPRVMASSGRNINRLSTERMPRNAIATVHCGQHLRPHPPALASMKLSVRWQWRYVKLDVGQTVRPLLVHDATIGARRSVACESETESHASTRHGTLL